MFHRVLRATPVLAFMFILHCGSDPVPSSDATDEPGTPSDVQPTASETPAETSEPEANQCWSANPCGNPSYITTTCCAGSRKRQCGTWNGNALYNCCRNAGSTTSSCGQCCSGSCGYNGSSLVCN